MCGGYRMADGRTGNGGWVGMMTQVAKDDALRKARGEPTKNFHDIKPNYSNPSIIAARDSVKSSTPAESTPSLPKSSGDSGLSIRRSSRSSSNTSNRRGGSRSGARKRYKTT